MYLPMNMNKKIQKNPNTTMLSIRQCNLDICNIDNMCRRSSSCMFNFKISNVRII